MINVCPAACACIQKPTRRLQIECRPVVVLHHVRKPNDATHHSTDVAKHTSGDFRVKEKGRNSDLFSRSSDAVLLNWQICILWYFIFSRAANGNSNEWRLLFTENVWPPADADWIRPCALPNVKWFWCGFSEFLFVAIYSRFAALIVLKRLKRNTFRVYETRTAIQTIRLNNLCPIKWNTR